MPADNQQIVHYAAGFDYEPRIRAVFDDYAHQAVLDVHPERPGLAQRAETADAQRSAAWRDLDGTRRRHTSQLSRYGSLGHIDDPNAHLGRLERDVATTRGELDTVQQHIGQLTTDPAVRVLPAGRLTHEHDLWHAGYDAERESERQEGRFKSMRADLAPHLRLDAELGHQRQVDVGRDSGPSIGR